MSGDSQFLQPFCIVERNVGSVFLRLRLPDQSEATSTLESAYGRFRNPGHVMIHGSDASLAIDMIGNQVAQRPGERVQKGWNLFFARFIRDVEGSPDGVPKFTHIQFAS
jgi:hypothetical protein